MKVLNINWKTVSNILKKEAVLVASLIAASLTAIFVPPTVEYFSYIDYKVLMCLFCLMVVVAGLKKIKLFEATASVVALKSSNIRKLSMGIILLTYISAMFITNDVALITLVPFTIVVLDKVNENRYAILVIVLQTIAANIGSSLTPVGNPQNLFLFSYYHLGLGEFMILLAPIVFLGGILLALSTLFIEKKPIKVISEMNTNSVNNKFLIIYCMLFVLAILAVFNIVPFILAGVILVLVVAIIDKKLFVQIDYSLLITFIGFFIFVGNVSKIHIIEKFLSELLKNGEFFISVVTSQIISNVPAAVLLSGFTENYKELLLGVNVGGMGTLIASLASVISYKIYTNVHPRLSHRYIKIFTGFNIVFLIVLSLASLLLLRLIN